MKIHIFTLFIVVLLVSTANAAERPAAIFLMINPGSPAVGMGGAFAGSIDDPSLLYYNPGGLGLYNNFGLLVMNQGPPPGLGRALETGFLYIIDKAIDGDGNLKPDAEWLPWLHPDMRYIYGSCIVPTKNIGNFGVQYTYLTTGTTAVIDPDGTFLGEYETYDYAVGVSYGRNLFNRLGLGISGKYIYSYSIPEWVWERMPELGIDYGGTADAFAFDCGTLFRIWGCGAGLAVQNIGTEMNYTEDTADGRRLPRQLRWGVAVDLLAPLDTLFGLQKYEILDIPITKIITVKFNLDRSYDLDDFDDVREFSGWQYTLFDFFTFRHGSLDFRGRVSGFGFKLRNLELDIAEYEDNNFHVQLLLHANPPPPEIQANERLNRNFTIACAVLAPGGGQFYKGEGIKGSLFFVPSLYLGHQYFKLESGSKKTWALIGIGALYAISAAEALLN